MLALRGHHGKVHTLAFSPDGKTLASVAGHAQHFWLWDLVSEQVLERVPHSRRIVSIAFAPLELRTLAFADSQGTIGLWQVDQSKGKVFDNVTPWPGHPVRLAFSPDGERMATTGQIDPYQPPTYPWRARCGLNLWEFDHGYPSGKRQVGGASWGLTCVSFSPNGQTLAAGGLDGWVYFWEGEKSADKSMRLNHGSTIHYLAYSPDGSTLISASQSGLIKVWDAHCGTKRTTLKGQGKYLHAIACSTDGATLATGSGDGSVRFWDLKTGKLRRAFDWGVGEVHSVAFAPDGFRAAAGGIGDIMIWDIDEW